MFFKYLLIVLSLFPSTLHAAHILAIFGVPIPSNYAFIEPLLKEMARRGHQITSISNYPQKELVNNFRDVVVEENKYLYDEFRNCTIHNIDTNYYEMVETFYNRTFKICTNILNDSTVRYIIDNEKIDLIIFDVVLMESLFGLSEYLKAPIVGVSNMGAMLSIDELVGNISPMSYIPHMFLPLQQMNFWQRLLNVVLNFIDWAHYYLIYMPMQKQIYDLYFPNARLSFEEAQKNFSLVLVNDHFSLNLARPYVTNMIEVAGLHITTESEPITPAIKFILDSAREGVILMAFDVMLPPHLLKLFLQQFQIMPQTILWKTSQKILNLPSNVYADFNLSLPSLLAHPKIKLYATTGGFLGITESVYYGLPILQLISANQNIEFDFNIKTVGNSLSLKLESISEKILAKAFNQLLATSHYRDIAKTLSYRFRDQQNTPMERAVYWIEYVLRHNGADHMRNLGQNLSWWQFYNIDVFLFMMCLFAFVVIVALTIFKILVEYLGKFKWRQNINATAKKIK